MLSYIPELDGTPSDVLNRLLDDATCAEDLGYDSFWLSEHHFENFGGLLAAPPVIMGALAQRTKRMRLGIGVSLLPLHHPLAMAEQWATVDVLSGGRLDLGIGRGFSGWEYHNYGVPMAEARNRFNECLDLMLTAWEPGRFDFHGKYVDVHDLQILPKPVQRPHPPLWAAAVMSRESFEWAARRGYDLMIAPFLSDTAKLRESIRLYQAGLNEAGYDPRSREVLANLQVCVAPTTEEALAIATPCFDRYLEINELAHSRGAHAGSPNTSPSARQKLAGVTVADLAAQGKMLVGSPEDCIRNLRLLNTELSVTHVIGTFFFGGMALEHSRRSLELFMREVAPEVRGLEVVPQLAAA